jgi:hypothetical protein
MHDFHDDEDPLPFVAYQLALCILYIKQASTTKDILDRGILSRQIYIYIYIYRLRITWNLTNVDRTLFSSRNMYICSTSKTKNITESMSFSKVVVDEFSSFVHNMNINSTMP